jgi:hypothetical protein
VLRLAKPQQQVGINFGLRTRIQKRVNVYFADIGRAEIAVCLGGEAIGCAGVIGGLRR